MKQAVALLFALVALTSCMNERKAARQINKWVQEYPSLRDTVVVTVHDTVITKADTVFQAVDVRDTVTIETERQKVRIVRIHTGSPCDTAVFRADILATVKPDTIVVTNTVHVPRIATGNVGIPDWWKTIALIGWSLLLVAALVLGLALRRSS